MCIIYVQPLARDNRAKNDGRQQLWCRVKLQRLWVSLTLLTRAYVEEGAESCPGFQKSSTTSHSSPLSRVVSSLDSRAGCRQMTVFGGSGCGVFSSLLFGALFSLALASAPSLRAPMTVPACMQTQRRSSSQRYSSNRRPCSLKNERMSSSLCR